MSILTALVATVKVFSGLCIFLGFFASICLIVLECFVKAEDKRRPFLWVISGIPAIFLWLLILIFVMGNIHEWFSNPWFEKSPPQTITLENK